MIIAGFILLLYLLSVASILLFFKGATRNEKENEDAKYIQYNQGDEESRF